MFSKFNIIVIVLLLTGVAYQATAQDDVIRRMQGMGGRFGGGGGGGDSIAHRTGLEDSLTIRFRYLDSSRMRTFDSALYDFTKVYPLPWDHVTLGNFGTASRPLVFKPLLKAGWDHGFHAFDPYLYKLSETRFYNTTRPFTQMDYLLGAQSEQMIQLTHTQNIRPNWNAGFQYRLINSPGFFQNQNTNHNNYRFHSWYQSKNKRYQNFVVLIGNKLQAGENGGIRTDVKYLDSAAFSERSTIPTQLGLNQPGSRNFFTTSIATGSFFTDAHYMMRQQYDLGQKDSIVTDSSVIPLFYPRLRLEHTITYNTYKYRFRDNNADSAYYNHNYGIAYPTNSGNSFFIQDFWKVMVNDFSVYQFPDAKNAAQFIKVGATMENISGNFNLRRNGALSRMKDYNFLVHGEYRNKTRNQKWDLEAYGQFYVHGYNGADYDAYASLKRLLPGKLGYLQLGFRNVNRSPSMVYDQVSAFYMGDSLTFNKENITNIFGSLEVPHLKLKLAASYYLLTNLTYFRDIYQPDQSSSPFNILQVTAEKEFRIGGNWNWRTWLVLQQRAGNGPVNMPLLTTRNQVGYDGNLGFKNLRTSFGLEFRYFTAYDAPVYSPLQGQYAYQDTERLSLKLPDISAYLHFRIRTFTAYVRAENLNSLDPTQGGFLNNNVPTFNYPYPGLQIRVGIFWTFVN
ncbi:MAG: hypothetical protein P0Y53_14710 [Candidatus Pseudobacter hemicellulosilyticus]|uniref:Beta-barrel porin n=1 Tax=Candidatus Pseudobacter hemicellulosilyticus TaxID=3121375 RepID=A0AAJ6BDK8_9BACT|nr:MAG: hypothetical protein P0Y53_14710 [Pseudobacter sp.]